MRIRTFAGLLLAIVGAILLSYLTHHNTDLLQQDFRLTRGFAIPAWAALLGVFLLGLLPPVAVLLVQTLRRELARRRERRRDRVSKSRRGVFRRAVDFQADGQWARAAREFEACLAEQPEDFGTLLRYGEVLRRQGSVEAAIEVHQRASVLYPRSGALLFELADDYEAAGKPEVGEEIHNRILREFPGLGLRVLKRRRNAALAAADWKEAARLQERLETLRLEGDGEVAPDEAEREEGVRMGLAYERAMELMEAGRAEEAKAVFEELLEREPRFIPAGIMLGEAELLRDDPALALAVWRQGYDSTGSPVFLRRIEDHFIERGLPAEAIETFRAIVASSENDLLPRFFLGRLYYRLEMHSEALKALESLHEEVDASPTFHLLLARIHERRGELGRAVESYLRCVQQAGVGTAGFVCRSCSTRFDEWSGRCENCGAWNAIESNIEGERLSASELGIQEGPIWTLFERLAGDSAQDGGEP